MYVARVRLQTSGLEAAAVGENGSSFAGQDYSYCRRASSILRLRLGDGYTGRRCACCGVVVVGRRVELCGELLQQTGQSSTAGGGSIEAQCVQ